jgi:hypothetical protein
VVVSLGGGHLLGDGLFVALVADALEVLAFDLSRLGVNHGEADRTRGSPSCPGK